MPSIDLHGKLRAFTHYVDAVPWLELLFDMVNNILNGHLDDKNVYPGGLSAVSMADGIGIVTSGQYTGDGTANRVISLSFTPRRVLVLSHTDSIEFTGLGSGIASFAAYHRTSTGALVGDGTGNADWQGIVIGGFKLGASGTGLSNKNTQTYSYVAFK